MPDRVEIYLDGHLVGKARLGLPREDLRGAGIESAGFDFAVRTPDRCETIEFSAVVVAADGTRFELEPRRVSLQPPDPPHRNDGPRLAARALVPSPNGHHGLAEPRVVCFTHQLGIGGAQLFLQELLFQLSRNPEFSAEVVSPVDGPLREELEAAGFPVHITAPLQTHSEAAYEGRIAELVSWLSLRPCDVLLANTLEMAPAVDVAHRLGLPVVWAIHESLRPDHFWDLVGLDSYVRGIARRSLQQANAVVFVAEGTRDLYREHVEDERAHVLPYGVDVDSLLAWRDSVDRRGLRAELGLGDDDAMITCVGTMEPRKAQLPLIASLARLRDKHPKARLFLIGDLGDEYGAAARRLAAGLDLAGRVHVVPLCRDPRPYQLSSDLVVCASDMESLPRSVLEAMALGIPVLATEIFGLAELIEDGVNGWLCPPRDVAGLTEGLSAALRNPSATRRAVAGVAQRRIAAEHNSPLCTQAYARLLRTLARRDTPAPASQMAASR